MRTMISISTLILISTMLFACAPNAPKVKRTGLKRINEAYLYPAAKNEQTATPTLSTYSGGKTNGQ